MKHQINASLQIIPKSMEEHTYMLVDKAIEVIAASGLPYQVTPMETVVEGPYDKIMEIFKEAQNASLNAGASELIVFIKIHISKERDITFNEKTEKYN